MAGAMVYTVMNSARPIRTEFGGTWAVPIADLIIERTIMILRNDVIEISRKGRSDNIASVRVICMLLLNPGEFIMPVISRPARFGAAAYDKSNIRSKKAKAKKSIIAFFDDGLKIFKTRFPVCLSM